MPGIGKGVLWTGLATGINFVVQLIIIGYYTNNISTTEFGKISALIIVFGLSQIFMDLGISNFIISKKSIPKEQLTIIFWFNIVLGISITFVIHFSADYISKYFENKSLSELLKLLSYSFIFLPISKQYLTILQKELRFKLISIIEIVSRIIWGLIIIYLVRQDFNSYSFVYATVSNSVLTTILFMLAGSRFFFPKLNVGFAGTSEIFRFGFYQLGELSLNYFTKEFDKIIIGRTLGLDTLGIYSVFRDITFRLGNMIVFTISRVYFPILSRLQTSTNLRNQTYLTFSFFVTMALFACYALLFISRDFLTHTIINEEFAKYIDLIKLFGLFYFLRYSIGPVATMWLSQNRPEIGFRWNLALFIVLPIVIYIFSQYSISTLLVSLIIAQVIQIVLSYFVLKLFCSISFIDFIKPISMSLISLLILFNINRVFPDGLIPIYRTFTEFIVFSILFAIVLSVSHKNIKGVINEIFYSR